MIVKEYFLFWKTPWWIGNYMIQAAQSFWRWNPVFLRSSFTTLDCSDQTISLIFPLIKPSRYPKPFDQTVVQPMKLCEHSQNQKTSDQTIVRPNRLWSNYRANQNFMRF